MTCPRWVASTAMRSSTSQPWRCASMRVPTAKECLLRGVEPICAVLSEHGCPIAPSTYYGAIGRPPSPRAARDEQLKAAIAAVHQANYGVYGARKVWLALNRERTPGA